MQQVFFRQMYLLARRPEADPFLPPGLLNHTLGNQIHKAGIFNDVCPFHPVLAVSLLEKPETRGFEFYDVLPPQYLFTAALLLTAIEMRVAVNERYTLDLWTEQKNLVIFFVRS